MGLTPAGSGQDCIARPQRLLQDALHRLIIFNDENGHISSHRSTRVRCRPFALAGYPAWAGISNRVDHGTRGGARLILMPAYIVELTCPSLAVLAQAECVRNCRFCRATTA